MVIINVDKSDLNYESWIREELDGASMVAGRQVVRGGGSGSIPDEKGSVL